jgi:hypothetical protein
MDYRYLPTSPQCFRIGDLVEVEFALVAYKMRADQYILKPMLYSIVPLDGQFGNVSQSLDLGIKHPPSDMHC